MVNLTSDTRESATVTVPEHGRRRLRKIWPYLMAMGPGLIAANAGNDAGGIATYASAGATYGYAFLWVMLVILFCLGTVQEMCARLGAVTGKGFSDLVRENFSLRMTAFILFALLIANFGVIVTEFVGIGAAAEMFGVNRYIAVPVSALLLWLLITRGSYDRVEKIFLVLTLVFLSYIGAAFLGKPDWHAVLDGIIVPTIKTDPEYLTMLIALIGTTITPYMQLYVTSSVAERGVKPEDYRFTRVDVWSGTFFAVAISGFIIIATAATLFPIGKQVETAADAALALAPIAGPYASYLFAIGLLGACLLAGGVLPLSTTYVMSEALGFERGVSRSWSEAPVFIGMFTVLLVLGAALALIPNLPVIPVLLGVQVVNGLLLPIELFAILQLINNPELMGSYVNGKAYNLLAWTIAIVVSLLSLSLIVLTVLDWCGVKLGG
ncbi:MAG: Divalent metal cation transporter MntH [Candidatus Accumulibacter phosphatis]|uniref:Divalent metal cation transporter MntH n=1 Tax=Candidatus Accumulibacter phosphatis TaxID=327160 RepID=A0A080M0P4_9PROT|nr:Nramp family divalent metal transporter [Accumulibacter sp.]KFB74656.1 MAG: Divalent metal cation transporter MntH [Candidatus Accumulibacter phosphatis]MBL8406364.1 Nramp family divalent metal transporter [Accumulibacter sp.]HRF12690.1 Nramp family divalent metal transporter [Candidatus Accumulibacter phosphatis]